MHKETPEMVVLTEKQMEELSKRYSLLGIPDCISNNDGTYSMDRRLLKAHGLNPIPESEKPEFPEGGV